VVAALENELFHSFTEDVDWSRIFDSILDTLQCYSFSDHSLYTCIDRFPDAFPCCHFLNLSRAWTYVYRYVS
jgi:hypothetical protein